MQRYIIIRVLQAIPTLIILSIVVFSLSHLTGDPLDSLLAPWADQEQREAVSQRFGLDKSLPVQYGIYLKGIAQGDLGTSIKTQQPVSDLIKQRYPNTLKLAFVAMGFAALLAIPIGVASAVYKDTWVDRFGKIIALLGQSMPTFWLGLILILVIAVRIHWLPTSGAGGPEHYILPAITLGWFATAGFVRLIRSGMLDTLGQEFIKLARLKGAPESVVVWKHAFRNALVPVLTFAGIMFASFLAGSVVTETVFAWPGLGSLAVDAIRWRDFPVVQSIVLVIGVSYIGINLLVDLVYAYVDPRIRY